MATRVRSRRNHMVGALIVPSLGASREEMLAYLQNPMADPAYLAARIPYAEGCLQSALYNNDNFCLVHELPFCRAVAKNPNCPLDALLTLLWIVPEDVLRNPATALLLLENPLFFTNFIAAHIRESGNSLYVQRLFGKKHPSPLQQQYRDVLIGTEVASLSGFTEEHPDPSYHKNCPTRISLTSRGFFCVETMDTSDVWPALLDLKNAWKFYYWPGYRVSQNMHNFVMSATQKTGDWASLLLRLGCQP